jgi:hypothetical protein
MNQVGATMLASHRIEERREICYISHESRNDGVGLQTGQEFVFISIAVAMTARKSSSERRHVP